VRILERICQAGCGRGCCRRPVRARNGLAFIDAAATGLIPVGGLSFAPTVHVLLARDPATRITSPTDQARRFKAWIGTTVTFTRALRAAPKKS